MHTKTKHVPRAFDNTRASREGWSLFNGNELQRLDEAGIFASDLAAYAYVADRAARGSSYHMDAVKQTSVAWARSLWSYGRKRRANGRTDAAQRKEG